MMLLNESKWVPVNDLEETEMYELGNKEYNREEGASIDKMHPCDWIIGKPVKHFLSYWWGKTQTIVSSAISGPVILAEQDRRSKPVIRTLPWPFHHFLPPGSCPGFFQWGTAIWKHKLNMPFPFLVVLVMLFHHSNDRQSKTPCLKNKIKQENKWLFSYLVWRLRVNKNTTLSPL